jgi:hypothetical protein
VKIAFDENVSVHMVRVFKSLGQEKREGHEFVGAADYAPKPRDADYVRKSDVPWLTRFANDNGKVVISGNTKMMSVPHEMEALHVLHLLALSQFEIRAAEGRTMGVMASHFRPKRL